MSTAQDKTKEKESLVKTIAWYSSSNIYRRILGILNVFIKPKLLSPEMYGLWNILNLIPRYASYLDFGARDAMRFLIPKHELQKETETIEKIKGSVLYGSLLPYLLIASIIMIIAFFIDVTLKVRVGLLTMSIVIMLQWYLFFYESYLKSFQKFKLISLFHFMYASMTVFFSLILIYLFNLYGAYISLVVAEILIILFLRKKSPIQSYGAFHLTVFRSLIKKGITIKAFGLCILLLRTTDRFIISYFLGMEQLGYYAIALMVLQSFMLIPGASRQVIEPRIVQDIGNHSTDTMLSEYIFKPLLNSAYYLPFLIGPVIFLLPTLITLVLPRYIPGIIPTQILIIGAYFLGLTTLIRSYIIANNWHVKVLGLIAIVLIINVGLISLLVKMGYGLIGVAIGGSVSNFALFVFLLFFIKRESRCPKGYWRKNLSGIIWPFPLMCISIAMIEFAFHGVHANLFFQSFIKLGIFFFTNCIIIFIAQKKISLLQGMNLKKIFRKDGNHDDFLETN